MMHDTYYVVAHFEWVMLLTVASFCLLAIWAFFRKSDKPNGLNKWTRVSVRLWTAGLLITLGGTFATRFISFQAMIDALWIMRALNATLAIGAFLLLLAVALTLLTAFVWLWTLLRPTAD